MVLSNKTFHCTFEISTTSGPKEGIAVEKSGLRGHEGQPSLWTEWEITECKSKQESRRCGQERGRRDGQGLSEKERGQGSPSQPVSGWSRLRESLLWGL